MEILACLETNDGAKENYKFSSKENFELFMIAIFLKTNLVKQLTVRFNNFSHKRQLQEGRKNGS